MCISILFHNHVHTPVACGKRHCVNSKNVYSEENGDFFM